MLVRHAYNMSWIETMALDGAGPGSLSVCTYALYDLLDMCHHRREPERESRHRLSFPPSTILAALR